MSVELPGRDFFTASSTIDFIVPESEAFREYIKDKPYIIPHCYLGRRIYHRLYG